MVSHSAARALSAMVWKIPVRAARTWPGRPRLGGYIPTNLSLDVAIEAMQFVRAGGIFVPASSIMSGHNRPSDGSLPGAKERFGGIFTTRQAAVVKALREGKANKRIAHELDMRESTVKVHVRNIMRKLNARNRTEVAYRTNGMFENDES